MSWISNIYATKVLVVILFLCWSPMPVQFPTSYDFGWLPSPFLFFEATINENMIWFTIASIKDCFDFWLIRFTINWIFEASIYPPLILRFMLASFYVFFDWPYFSKISSGNILAKWVETKKAPCWCFFCRVKIFLLEETHFAQLQYHIWFCSFLVPKNQVHIVFPIYGFV